MSGLKAVKTRRICTECGKPFMHECSGCCGECVMKLAKAFWAVTGEDVPSVCPVKTECEADKNGKGRSVARHDRKGGKAGRGGGKSTG